MKDDSNNQSSSDSEKDSHLVHAHKLVDGSDVDIELKQTPTPAQSGVQYAPNMYPGIVVTKDTHGFGGG